MLVLCLLALPVCWQQAAAQAPQWANSIGSQGNDDGKACAVAPNGNVYVAGVFTSTIDLDPSAAVYNVTSNGLTDIFLACYTPSGNFLWGLGIGGTGYDGALNLAVDKNNNVIIVGYFRGQGINFDPLSAGKYLSDNGAAGPVLQKGGDGFAAKYNSSGACMWAIDLGGSSIYDLAEGVAADENGNVYVGGDFHYTMDIDPGPGVTTLNANNGTGYLIKYTSAGNLAWGFTFGAGGNNGVDNTVWDIKAANGYVYSVGLFEGTSDFDPSPATALLTTAGGGDGYLAKYDTSGHYQFAIAISGTGDDAVYGLALDSLNVYITGSTVSPSLTFGRSGRGSTNSPGGGGNGDIFMAKYTKAGRYVWGEMTGGHKDESGLGIAVKNNVVYTTGYFNDTADFDPSPAVATLVSKGNADIYFCKYDTAGHYMCGFSIGGRDIDIGRKLAVDDQGYLYACGQFSDFNVDFDPEPTTYALNSIGSGDVFLAKYNWMLPPAVPSGYFTGDTVCRGQPAHLKFVALSGTAPYTIIYTNGTRYDTLTNVQTTEDIPLYPAPQATTIYKLVYIGASGNCEPPGYPDTDAVVLVHPRPAIIVSNDTTVCPGTQVVLHSYGGTGYLWYPPAGLDSPSLATTTAVVYSNTVYNATAINIFGCADTASVSLSVFPLRFAVQKNKGLCIGDTLQLVASGADTYLWLPRDSVSNDSIADPIVWPKQDLTFTVIMKEYQCGRIDTTQVPVKVHPLPDVRITNAQDLDCGHRATQLVAMGAQQYIWSPDTAVTNTTAAATTVAPHTTTRYEVTGTDENACKNKDSADVLVFNTPTGRLFAPTAFTPNGDGKNDCYKINIPGTVSGFEFMVYNRWGNLVYISYNYDGCWDGSCHGVSQDMGTYYYYYKCYTSACGAIHGQGDFILIR